MAYYTHSQSKLSNNSLSSQKYNSTLVPLGYNATTAAPSAQSIKSQFPSATDGVYYINLPTVGVQPVYCLMDSIHNGGGWMLAMKATRGTTFNFFANYWTTANTLNTSSIDRTDADAKFDTFNQYQAKDIMALWPDINQIGGGYSDTLLYNWTWLENNFYGGNRTTLLNFFSTAGTYNTGTVSDTGNYGGYFLGLAKNGPSWANGVFSSQNAINFYGMNFKNYPNPSYGNGVAKVRWGFGFNENSEPNYSSPSSLTSGTSAIGSNDVSGGIGLDSGFGNYSAGDYIGCCNDSTGINRSARVEIYVR